MRPQRRRAAACAAAIRCGGGRTQREPQRMMRRDGTCSEVQKVYFLFFMRKPSLLIGKGERGPMSRSQTDKHTHTAPHTRTPPPRLGGKETRGWSSPRAGYLTGDQKHLPQGIHGRRGVPPEARLEAPAPWRTFDSARPSPSPASTPKAASAFPLIAHSADPSGSRVPPWGSTRAAPILARPSTPASAPSRTYGNYPRRGLEPAARNPHPQQDCLQLTCSPTTFACGGRE